MTTDMSAVIVPKSDQINADDLIAGPRTYTIEAVRIEPGTEQPVNIKLAGEPRAWRPCKSMSRVLVNGWGPDAKVYPGRSVTLYRDPKVKWGGMEVGGIRVSHMSHIDREMLIQLTATKGKRAPHVVKPLTAEVAPIKPPQMTARQWTTNYIDGVDKCQDIDTINAFANERAGKLADLEAAKPALHLECLHALDNRRAALAVQQEGKPDEQQGEGFTGGEDTDWEA